MADFSSDEIGWRGRYSVQAGSDIKFRYTFTYIVLRLIGWRGSVTGGRADDESTHLVFCSF